MTDWIHCNICYVHPSPSIQFFLTSCGHIFCTKCVEKHTKPACHVCENTCNVIPLSSKMEQSVKMFFQTPSDILEKQLQELMKVMDFQSGHRKRLLTKTKEKLERSKELHEEFKKATAYIQHLERKLKVLTQENEYLRRLNPGALIPEQGHTARNPMSQLQNTSPFSFNPENNLPGNKFPSPNTDFLARNSYHHPPPPPPATRLTVRTPPSGGRMGVIPGNNPSTPRSDVFHTPNSRDNTPNRGYSQSVQDTNSISLPNRNQNKLPGSRKSLNGSNSGNSDRTTTPANHNLSMRRNS